MFARTKRPLYHQDKIHWPSCAKCNKIVDAYGMENETKTKLEIWARHHGERDGIVILKGPFWGPNSLNTIMRSVVFFAPTTEAALSRGLGVADPKKGWGW